MLEIRMEPQRTAWDLRWSMFRIPVRVHPLFWLICLWFSYNKEIPFPAVLISIACMFVSILVHEFGHALSHRHYGSRDMYIVLHSMGGLCISTGTPPRWPRIASLLWGPGAGFLLGVPAYIAGAVLFGPKFPIQSVFTSSNEQYYLLVTLNALVWINMIWGFVNLLPIFPLDGGQILREWVQWKRPQRGDAFAFKISFYTALAATVVSIGLFLAFDGKDFRNLYPAFLFGSIAYSNHKLRQQIELYGDSGGGHDDGPRQPWEQDADWWKRS